MSVEMVNPLEQAEVLSVPEAVLPGVLPIRSEQGSSSLAKQALPVISSALFWVGLIITVSAAVRRGVVKYLSFRTEITVVILVINELRFL